MIARTVVAAAAALMLVSTASAATLVVNAEPTLSNIVVELPACGQASTAAGVSVAWTPERTCAAADDEAPLTQPDADSANLQHPDTPDSAPAQDTTASESDATSGAEPSKAEDREPAPSPDPDAGTPEAKPSAEPSTSTAGPAPSAEPDASAVAPTGDAATPGENAAPETASDARPTDE